LLPVFWSPGELTEFGKELEEYRSELFKKEYLPHIRAYPKVRNCSTGSGEIVNASHASSAKGDELNTYKKVVRIDDLITAQTSSDDAEISKPPPDIFEAAVEKPGDVAPDSVLVVGDTPYDSEAAAKARSVKSVTRGFVTAG